MRMKLGKAAAVVIALACVAGASPTTQPAAPKSAFETRFWNASPLAKWLGTSADAALDQALAPDADWDACVKKANDVFRLTVAYGSPNDLCAFREADFARRLLTQMQPLNSDDRQDLLKFFRTHDDIAKLIAFAIRPGDDVPNVYRVFDLLRHERPRQVEVFTNLAVAMAVVRDKPLEDHINENTAHADDVLAVFDFFTSHERTMVFGLRNMPVELLTYVVDTTSTVDELNWANWKYARTTDLGPLFFSIKYDGDYFNGKAEKKLDVAGFSLRNILKVGGVCVDQAYFAASVGKALGIPTTIAGAASAGMAHAWVGYLQYSNKVASWNFDAGRYDEYKGIRGNVRDPQTGQSIADSSVAMTCDMIGTTVDRRQVAVAMVDAVGVLMGPQLQIDPSKSGNRHQRRDPATVSVERVFAVPGSEENSLKLPDDIPVKEAREANATNALELIQAGLYQFNSYAPGWEMISAMARNDLLSEPQIQSCASFVQKLCGTRHPDFALAILEPMVDTVKEPYAQSGIWDALFAMMSSRPDLAAEVRLKQAAMWHENGDLPKSGICYQDVVQRYINAGPFALQAVEGAEKVLIEMGQPDKVLTIYAIAYKLVDHPTPSATHNIGFNQSNWYKLREAYAKRLEDAGQTRLAASIRNDGEKVGNRQ